MPSAAHTYRMASPHLQTLRCRILSSRTFSFLSSPFSLLSSRRSRSSPKSSPSDSTPSFDPSSFSDDSLRKEKMEQGVGRMTFATQLARGDLEHMDVCESFVGVGDVSIPSATLVRSCMRSCDRLNGRDLEMGEGEGGFYDVRDWRRVRMMRMAGLDAAGDGGALAESTPGGESRTRVRT